MAADELSVVSPPSTRRIRLAESWQREPRPQAVTGFAAAEQRPRSRLSSARPPPPGSRPRRQPNKHRPDAEASYHGAGAGAPRTASSCPGVRSRALHPDPRPVFRCRSPTTSLSSLPLRAPVPPRAPTAFRFLPSPFVLPGVRAARIRIQRLTGNRSPSGPLHSSARLLSIV